MFATCMATSHSKSWQNYLERSPLFFVDTTYAGCIVTNSVPSRIFLSFLIMKTFFSITPFPRQILLLLCNIEHNLVQPKKCLLWVNCSFNWGTRWACWCRSWRRVLAASADGLGRQRKGEVPWKATTIVMVFFRPSRLCRSQKMAVWIVLAGPVDWHMGLACRSEEKKPSTDLANSIVRRKQVFLAYQAPSLVPC